MRTWAVVAVVTCLLCGGTVLAQEAALKAPSVHQIEGSGGVVLTETAYLVNPSTGDDWLGFPSFSASHLMSREKDLGVFAISETLFKRLELSYALHRVDLGDFDDAVAALLPGASVHDTVYMHNLNARLLLLDEGQIGTSWSPAVALGVHYKKNTRFDELDRDLGRALEAAGADDDEGVDFTLMATKKYVGVKLSDDVVLPPFFLSGGVRATEAAQIGWLGFTNHYAVVFEGNVGVFVLDNVIVSAEYRQKHEALHKIPGLVGEEDDWWAIAASFIVNEHVNFTAAYTNLGRMMNHREPMALWLQLKIEL